MEIDGIATMAKHTPNCQPFQNGCMWAGCVCMKCNQNYHDDDDVDEDAEFQFWGKIYDEEFSDVNGGVVSLPNDPLERC